MVTSAGFSRSRDCFDRRGGLAMCDRFGDVGGVRIRLCYAGGGRVQSPQIRARQGRSSTGARREPLPRHRNRT